MPYAHREDQKAQHARYYAEHKYEDNRRCRLYQMTHKTELREYRRNHYKTHLSIFKAAYKRYYEKHKCEIWRRNLEYRNQHLEQAHRYNTKSRRNTNPLILRLRNTKFHDRISAKVDYKVACATLEEHDTCYACGEKISFTANRVYEPWTYAEISRIDPEIPHFLDGRNNMTVLCRMCNALQGTYHLADLGSLAYTYLVGDIIPQEEFEKKHVFTYSLWVKHSKIEKYDPTEIKEFQRRWRDQLDIAFSEFNYCLCPDTVCIFRPSLDSKVGHNHKPDNTEVIPFGLNAAKMGMSSTDFWPMVYRKLRAILVNYEIEFDEKDLCPLFRKHLGI